MYSLKKPFTIFLIILLSLTSTLVLFPPAQAATTWIDITLPYTITEGGSYRVTSAWTGTGVGLSINASNVVVDGQNNLIELNQTEDSDYAIVIAPGSSNVLLENINQTSADYGLYAEEGNFTTRNSTFTNNTSSGIFAYNASDFTIQHSRLSNNSYGLVTIRSNNFAMTECHVKNNTFGIETYSSSNFTIADSYLNENDDSALVADECINFNLTNCILENNQINIMSNFSGNFTVDNSIIENGAIGLACVRGNFTVTNSALNNNTFGVYSVVCDRVTVYDANITNNLVAIYGALSNFTVRDSELSYGMYGVFVQESNVTVNRCNINNNTIGLITEACNSFALEDCNVHNNADFGMVDYYGNNTLVNSNAFSRNGLDAASASGAVMVEDSNCTVTNNVFDSNYDSILMGIYDEEANNTQVYQGNTFRNNNYTLDFNYQLPSNYTNQQIYFYNNFVNDSAYVNPESFTDDDQYVPSSAVFHFNSTLHLGTRPYSSGPVIGGNFWAYPNGTGFSQIGTDSNHDGFIDTSFELFGNASLGAVYDYHPYSLGFDVNSWVSITLPETITQAGNYKIASPWNGEGVGLEITASNVVVDGQNNRLTLSGADNDFGVSLYESTNVLLKNIRITNGEVAVYAGSSSNFTLQDLTLSNNTIVGFYAYGCSNFTVQNSVLEASKEFSGMYVSDCTGFVVKGCSLNNNDGDGLTAHYSADFTVIDSVMNNNGWGIELFDSSNGVVRSCSMSYNSQAIYVGDLNNVNFTDNVFSNNGLASGTYTGGVEASNSNCTVAYNTFESNYDALLWSPWNSDVTATFSVHDNVFHNNTYTFFFYIDLPNNFTGQKLLFYNNLVNDTSYVDLTCLNATYSGNHLPFNSQALNLNSTLQSGTRIYGNPSKIGGNFWTHPDGSGISQTGTDNNRDGFVDAAFDLFGNAPTGDFYDYLPYSQNYSKSLAYTAGASQTSAANQTSSLITVRLQDAYGPVTSGVAIGLTSNSTTAKFYSDVAGTAQITSVTISAGSSTASFYFQDTTAGNPTLTASSAGVISAIIQFTVNPHASNVQYITISPAASTVTAGNTINYVTTAFDQYGNSWNVTAAYTINDLEVSGSTLKPTTAGVYLIKATYNDMTASTTLTVTAAALDHFAVLVPNSALVGTPFEVMVVALDAYLNVVTGFSGTVSLSTNQGTIAPSTSVAFTQGVWTGTVTLTQLGSASITAADGSGHTGTSVNLTVSTSTPTPTPTPSATSTIQVTTSSGSTVNLQINGNITTTQISGATLTSSQSASTTTLTFTVTGQNGTTGFCNITIPKTQVAYGTTPTVSIDSQQASSQGFSQDSENYYVWFTTGFSSHQVQVQFSGQETANADSPIVWYAVIIGVVAVAAVALAFAFSRRKRK